MAKVWVFSDLHLDVNRTPFPVLEQPPEADMIVIAGDVCEDAVAAVHWIKAQAFTSPVIYVAGNHEFYHQDWPGNVLDARREAEGSCVHVLHDEALEMRINGAPLRVLGTTLWTDFRLFGPNRDYAMEAARGMLNDHRHIRVPDGPGRHRRLLPQDCALAHAEAVRWLGGELSRAFEGTTLVVTHHAPSMASVPSRYATHIISPAYASNLDHLVAKAGLWVHGHTHTSFDYRLGNCRVVCNPLGYGRENPAFNPALVVEVPHSGPVPG